VGARTSRPVGRSIGRCNGTGLARQVSISEVVAQLGISEATFHRWRTSYGGIKADDACRLRELEQENRDLKSVVANQCLDILMLRQVVRGKF
jgi:putative transposase